ncbi:hypothetical protein [Acuticoccus yangtzensis]|uniref:hypothetical protein n=1 Tax=Acuticoccus yangtzensis TaxID=1443441 RepID=UPI000D3E407C|nr:hypothetical protein [Acuticoccus yangtzensis]
MIVINVIVACILAVRDAITAAASSLETSRAAAKAEAIRRRFEKVLPSPKGTRVEAQSLESITISIACAIRFWWMLPIVMIPTLAWLSFIAGGVLGLIPVRYVQDGTRFGKYVGGGWTWWPTISLLVFSAILIVIVWRIVFPRLIVTATKEAVIINGRCYDRRHYEGLRIGYEAAGPDGMTFNLNDKQFGWTTLRAAYGRWGTELRYMLRSYRAAEIVVWANEMLSSVGKPPPREHDPSAGRKADDVF